MFVRHLIGNSQMIQIIVVDDSLTERTKAGGLLKRGLECKVRQADSGRAAVELIEESEPDIVVTDLKMPEMDGLELVELIGEEYPNVPVILMTAMGSEETAATAMRAGAASYVPKHRLAEDLVSTVNQVLSARNLSATPARVLSHMDECRMKLRLSNDFSLVQDAAETVQRMLVCLPLVHEGDRTRVGLAIEAALSNSLLRGNLEIPRDDERTREEFERLVHERSMQSPWRERMIHIDVQISRERMEITVRDEGPGFEVGAIDPAVQRLSSDAKMGRGLALMHTIMDSVIFNVSGNEVTMVKHRYVEPEIEDDDD